MVGANIRLTKQAWARIFRVTSLLTAISVVLSIIITNVIMEVFSEGINVQGLMVSIVTPLALGGPSMGFILYNREKLRAANEQLQRMASTDWLTGCLNRGAFTGKVTMALRTSAACGALLVVDIDHFKAINDTHGHDRGDDALVMIATTLASEAGLSVPLGRLGGEEFGLYLAEADEVEAAIIAERLRGAVARLAFVTDGVGCPLSVSIGGATFRGRTDFRSLYRMADACLYQAKAAGRDRVALIDAA